ncbi:MAG: OmpA family protein [Alphaproteobacteria bacterium]|nr:OmpA family protein [Alphaproteobacteria bacterium]
MKKIITFTAIAALMAGCTVNPYTGESQTAKAVWGTALGTAAGAATGALVSKNKKKGALVGAAAGAALGGGIGYYLDVQEAELRQELAGAGVGIERTDDSIRLIMPGNITFKTDSADINSGFYTTLNAVAKVLNKYSNTTVMVAGYTDNTGSLDYNQTLSRNRANAVASYLQGQGVKSSRFEIMGMGPSNPIASNSTAAGRQQNRRVEIKIIPNK